MMDERLLGEYVTTTHHEGSSHHIMMNDADDPLICPSDDDRFPPIVSAVSSLFYLGGLLYCMYCIARISEARSL